MAKRKAARVTGRKAASSKGNASRKAGAKSKKAAPKSASRKAVKKTAKKSLKKRPGATARKAAPKGSARKTARKATTRKAPAKKAAAKKTVARKAVARKAPARPVVKAAAPRPAPKAALPVRKAPALDRARRTVVDDDIVQTPPSSLDLDRNASAARSGRRELAEKLSQHNESSPALTAGDVDADWEGAYASGDEAPGGDNPTPDQDIVDDIGKAVGNVYQDNEELKGADKITKRDKHRWELDPASAEDYDDRE